MADLARFRTLSQREQALVAIAVLLDGAASAEFLSFDDSRGSVFSRVCKDLTQIPSEVRLPLMGTLLRKVIDLT